jgi:hypothetical protein
VFTLWIIMAAAIVLSGCGEDEAKDTGELQDLTIKTAESLTGVQIQYRPVALDAWLSIARRLQNGENVHDPDYERLFSLPAYQAIYGNDVRPRVNAVILKSQLEHSFAKSGRKAARTPKLSELKDNYTYIATHQDEIQTLIETLQTQGVLDQALNDAWPFIPDANKPESLDLLFFAAVPSITWYPPGTVILDIGLALAAGPDQLRGVLAATFIRSLAPPAMVEPHKAASGREALIATFHKLHQASTIGWLEDYPNLEFDGRHPTYQRPDPNRQRVIIDSAILLERFFAMLNTLVDPESDTIHNVGGSLDDLLRIGKKYEPIGYAMTKLIIEHKGEEGWLEVAPKGPVPWLQAYQDAATSNSMAGELATMPAFDTLTFTRLMALLERTNSEVVR